MSGMVLRTLQRVKEINPLVAGRGNVCIFVSRQRVRLVANVDFSTPLSFCSKQITYSLLCLQPPTHNRSAYYPPFIHFPVSAVKFSFPLLVLPLLVCLLVCCGNIF